MLVLIPLFLGIVHLALVLHVRNTLVSAASEGARYGATYDRTPWQGADRTRQVLSGVLGDRMNLRVWPGREDVGGYPAVVMHVRAEVPALGLWGPRTEISVEGHGVEEDPQ
ncbi:MAG: pilus assembly protein [Propionibacteriales bacterium]|nr:pilus assembly protein [Propionibacteriales bacterium]